MQLSLFMFGIESTPDSHQSHNSSIDELHQRVEKILKER